MIIPKNEHTRIPLNRHEFEMFNYMHVHSMTPFRIKTPKASWGTVLLSQLLSHQMSHTKCHISVT